MRQQTGSTTTKRKTLDDYFHKSADTKVSKIPRTEKQEYTEYCSDIPGLKVIAGFVTKQEECELLAFLDAQPWRTDLLRRVIHFGGTYCMLPPRSATPEERKIIENNIITAEPIPSTLEFVVNRLIQHGLYALSDRPQYCIVNEYKDNQGISAHVENFKFISPVCGLTLGNGDWMRFHELSTPDDGSVRSGKAAQAKRTGRRVDVWMPSRSLLVMSGEARERWQHEIVRSRRGRTAPDWKRVSLTFRAEKKSKP